MIECKSFFSQIHHSVNEHKQRLVNKHQNYIEIVNVQIPAQPDESEKIKLWQKAERLISTDYTLVTPDLSLQDFEELVREKEGQFTQKSEDFSVFLETDYRTFNSLINALQLLKADLSEYDLIPLETTDSEKQIVVLMDEMIAQLDDFNETLITKSTKSGTVVSRT